ncbi:MAG: recombination mediator RecR [Opitutae bacterium]|nr:recombination mediator RecR [Opitutae bacterium]MCD8298788.1 recombination mediator RecR [Opitutae bacterium]
MSAFEDARDELKKLPGIGFRSAERIALHLLVEHPEALAALLTTLADASQKISRCEICGNIAERGSLCTVCGNDRRDAARICVVEHVPDLMAIERAGTFGGTYHVLHGRLSPIRGITPQDLNFESLRKRVAGGNVEEIILALSNDIEGEATCHYIRETLLGSVANLKISRIGFGLPSGAILNFADPATLKSALESRREF